MTEREIEWAKFVERHPEYADPDNPERKAGDEIFNKQFNKKVASGSVAYADALDRTAIETESKLALVEIQNSRHRRD